MRFIVLYSKRQIAAMIHGKVLRKIRYDLLVVIQSRKMPKQHMAANNKHNLALQEHQDNSCQLEDNASDRFLSSKIHRQSGGPEHGPTLDFPVDSDPVTFFDKLFTNELWELLVIETNSCLLYTSPSPRDA